MTELFDFLTLEQSKVPGWCIPEKALALASIVIALRPAISLEIGVFGGSSFLPIAMAHKTIGYGMAIGVDAWDSVVGVREQTTNEDREWWSKLDINAIYNNFQNQLDKYKLHGVTQIIRKESRHYQIPHHIGFAHIDGSHGDTATSDIVRVAPNIMAGGIMALDDLQWPGGAVTRGEARLLQFGFKKLYALGTGAVYQRAT